MSSRRAIAGSALACAGLSVVVGVSGWDDSSAPGTAVLGGYRERTFLLAAGLAYAALVLVLLAWRGPSKRRVGRLVLVHMALLLALVTLELPALLGLIDYHRLLSGGAVPPAPQLRRATAAGARFDGPVLPDLVGVLGARAASVQVHFETDAQGLRNRRFEPDAPVLCLGDSVLVAGLLPLEDVVTDRMQRSLGEAVYNIAEPGYAPQEAWFRMRALPLRPRPRLVVQFLFEGNDLTDSASWHAFRAHHRSWPRSGLCKTLLGALHRPRRAAGARRSAAFGGGEHTATVYFLYDAGAIDAHAGELPALWNDLRRYRAEVTGAGGRYALVFVPCKLHVLHRYCRWPARSSLSDPACAESGFGPAAAAFAAAEGIPFLDLTPALQAVAAAGELPFFAADTHPNARGHAAMAASLEPWIRRMSGF